MQTAVTLRHNLMCPRTPLVSSSSFGCSHKVSQWITICIFDFAFTLVIPLSGLVLFFVLYILSRWVWGAGHQTAKVVNKAALLGKQKTCYKTKLKVHLLTFSRVVSYITWSSMNKVCLLSWRWTCWHVKAVVVMISVEKLLGLQNNVIQPRALLKESCKWNLSSYFNSL